MIAVITSTIKPSTDKTYYTYEERLEQTIGTIKSLRRAGFSKIYLVDNSPLLNTDELTRLLKDKDVEAYHIDQYQFSNKGINELLMLLYIYPRLAQNETIFKISGRYTVTPGFEKPAFEYMAVRSFDFNGKNSVISTRAYWVKNAQLFEAFLNDTLREVFAYPERVVGLRSFLKKFKNNFRQQGNTLNISIEFAAAQVLKRNGFKVTELKNLHIEGWVAGSDKPEKIIE